MSSVSIPLLAYLSSRELQAHVYNSLRMLIVFLLSSIFPSTLQLWLLEKSKGEWCWRFLMAEVAGYHELGGFKWQRLILAVQEPGSQKARYQLSHSPSEICRKFIPSIFPAIGNLLAILGPRLVAVSPHFTIFPRCPLCIPYIYCFVDITIFQDDLILTNYINAAPVSKSAHSLSSCGLGLHISAGRK